MTTDAAWDELASLLATIDRLRDELERCIGRSPNRNQLKADFFAAELRRVELVAAIATQSGKNLI
jgi:hypothetical protein